MLYKSKKFIKLIWLVGWLYHIAGMLGRVNAWQIAKLKVVNEKSLANKLI